MVSEDTITAIATAIGEGGIGIIRMSGPEAIGIADQIFHAANLGLVCEQQSHLAVYGHIFEPESRDIIDEVLLLVMRGPRSYTRENVVEIHCHGGPMPLRRILELTLRLGARLAEPGEFTKRAFLNGRLDLSQAEAVMDVIRSKTDVSLRMAVGHLGGAFSVKVSQLRHQLLSMIAQLEAAIDFPEDDIEELTSRNVAVELETLQIEIAELITTAYTGRILREGLKTVIIGKPNVGKSSLLNILLGENRAIVTNIPGTTRDVIEEYVNIGGIPLKIVDTAGIRETADAVEQIGVEKTREVMVNADLILVVLDASEMLTVEDKEVLSLLDGRQAIVLVNKTDLPSMIEMPEVLGLVPDKTVLQISALDGLGIRTLEETIAAMVYGGRVTQGEGAFVSNVRHKYLLEQVQAALIAAREAIAAVLPPDCVVIDLRAAWERLGEISGDTVGEDIIDQIFSQFCIGK